MKSNTCTLKLNICTLKLESVLYPNMQIIAVLNLYCDSLNKFCLDRIDEKTA